MAGAYVLAGELSRCGGDHTAAFERYGHLLRPMIERKQKGALWLGGWFAPKSALGLALRNGLSRLAAVPAFAPLLLGDMVSSGIVLPDYSRAE
jgi:2-polyprenyl-6-methoxyphenol hydroxylase-like FAD-dependent oxidoreductase